VGAVGPCADRHHGADDQDEYERATEPHPSLWVG
jgi:hypothetical protein